MARKGKGKIPNGKGLRGALARHELLESSKKKMKANLMAQEDQKSKKEKSMKSSNKKKKQQIQEIHKGFIPFNKDNSLILIGEGDFSFACSIIQQDYILPTYLIATSYDSREEVLSKYPTAEQNLKYLEDEGVKIYFNIDATNLVKSLKLTPSSKKKNRTNSLFSTNKKLDFIMFNFPHTGKGIKDVDRNIRDHQTLVLNYFKSCQDVFKLVNTNDDDFSAYSTDKQHEGKILLSMFEGEPYNSWHIKALGRSVDLMIERSGKFNWSFFPQYSHKRTNSTRDTTKPAAERDARIYLFVKFVKRGSKIKTDDSDSE